MKKEVYLKASSLWGKIACRKGVITKLHQRLGQTTCPIKQHEIEQKIKENVAYLDNLRKEFAEI